MRYVYDPRVGQASVSDKVSEIKRQGWQYIFIAGLIGGAAFALSSGVVSALFFSRNR